MKKFIFSRLIRESSWSFLLRVFQAVCSFLTTVLLARVLGVEGYGIYAYAYAFVTLLTIPAQAGLPTLVMRETAKGMAQENLGLVQGIWRWATKIVILVTSLLFVFETLFFLTKGFDSDLKMKTFFWAFLLVPLLCLGNLRGAALRGLHKVVIGQLPEFFIRPALFLLLLLAYIIFVSGKLTPPQAMALNVIASALAFIIGTWFLWQNMPPDLSKTKPIYYSRDWFFSLLPLAFIAGMLVINSQTDIIMLGFFKTSFHVGVYRVAVQLALLSSFGLQAINMVMAPRFASFYAQKEIDKIRSLAVYSARVVFVFSLFVTIFFLVAGKKFLSLVFGENYVLAYYPLMILLLGQLANSFVGSVGALLNMTKHEKDAAVGLAISAAVNVVLNLILIPKFDIKGAAISTAISMCVWNFILWWFVRKRLGVNSWAFDFRLGGAL